MPANCFLLRMRPLREMTHKQIAPRIDPILQDQEFMHIAEIVLDLCGIVLPLSKKQLVRGRLLSSL